MTPGILNTKGSGIGALRFSMSGTGAGIGRFTFDANGYDGHCEVSCYGVSVRDGEGASADYNATPKDMTHTPWSGGCANTAR